MGGWSRAPCSSPATPTPERTWLLRPGDPDALLGAASEGGKQEGLRHVAARFEGAWPYLQLIAACNGIGEPLDRRVVEAYWVGNELLKPGAPVGTRLVLG